MNLQINGVELSGEKAIPKRLYSSVQERIKTINPSYVAQEKPFYIRPKKLVLKTNQLYLSYVLKCRPTRAYDKPKARKTCINYLWEQLKIGPNVLLILGDIATQNYFEDPTAKVKNLSATIHPIHHQKIVVSYHPLTVRRRPILKKHFLEDWKLVASNINN